MKKLNKIVFLVLLGCASFASADILDRIEYKLGRVATQNAIIAGEVNELENIINGEPHVPFTNNDGNLYPVQDAVSPISLRHVSELSRLARSQAALRIPNIESFGGTWWRNCESACWLAVDPNDDRHMLVVLDQDRSNLEFSLGVDIFYTFDAGNSWTQSHVPLSRCQGASPGHSNIDFERAARPSVTFDSDGSSIYVVLIASNVRLEGDISDSSLHHDEAIILIKSNNGGNSWSEPQIIFGDDGADHFLASPTIWVNPYNDDVVYAAWTDMQFFVGNGNNSIIKVSRSLDAGTVWEPPVDALIVDSSIANFAPFEAQILVDPSPSHMLYLLVKNTQIFTPYPAGAKATILNSLDNGVTWNPVNVLTYLNNVAQDPDNPGTYIRTAAVGFDAAINNINGKLYAVAQTGTFAPPGLGGVAIIMSSDGGVTISTPIPVNPNSLSAQAFNPSIRIAPNGEVGVLYYDFRNHTPGNPALETDVWLAVFDENLTTQLDEIRITPVSFDTRQFMRADLQIIGIPGDNKHFFPGDYCKLQFTQSDFVAAFQVSNPPYGIGPSPIPGLNYEVELRNRQDAIFARIPQ